MICPDCENELGTARRCACGWEARRQAPTSKLSSSPELEYLRNFYRKCSADPVCPSCDARYESKERGPFDAGHWMVNHWKRHHPDLYDQHKARVGGRKAATTE